MTPSTVEQATTSSVEEEGDDTLTGGTGEDTLDGGAGTDTVVEVMTEGTTTTSSGTSAS
jgi:Ca2+-binding RTX toxin-like protein